MAKVKLGDVAVEYRKTCNGNKDGYPVVGLEHLIPSQIMLSKWSDGSDNTFTKMFRKGQMLFGRRRAYLKKAALAPFDGICSGDITIIEAIPGKILPELLPFIIQNNDLFDFAVGKSAGSLSPRVKWEHLRNYEFDLPPLEEQKKLAELLWSENATKNAYKKLLSALDELVKSRFIEMFGDSETNPKRWKSSLLGIVCTIERGGSPRPICEYITKDNDGLNWIKIGDADGTKYITKTEEKIKPLGLRKTRLVHAGDLILSNSMSFGRPYILKLDGCIHDGWLVLKFDHESIDPLFLYSYLSLPSTYRLFEAMAAGGVVNNLNSEVVRMLPIILPPLSLQQEFAAFVESVDKSKFQQVTFFEGGVYGEAV